TVEYYLENAAGTGYDKMTEPKTGTTAATVTATQKAFDHFTYSAAKSTPTGTVSADGTLVLKMYYLRDTYTVTFSGNGGTLKSGTAIQTVRYGNAAAIPSFTRNGYTFTGWDSTAGCDAVAGDLTVTAQWQTISYSVTYDPNGGTLGGVDPATYTVESDVPLTPPTRSLYAFAGWYDQDGTKVENLSGHFGNLTLTARWTAGFTVSDAGEITAILPEIRAGATEIVIPADLDGVAITSIGDGVFADCPLLTTVTIPEGIVSIGEGAFKNCAALTDVIWNAIACTVAGSDSDPVFAECPLLERAVFGVDVTAIPDFCFCDCSGLSSVTLSSGIGTIGERAFAGCASLTGIDLPDGLTAIGARAFLSAGLTAVSIPAGVQTVGDGAFQNCAALASVSIGVNVSAIGAYAFQGSGLFTATFLDENGWYVTTVSGANAGTDISVSVPAQNAARLTTEYASYFWYKN
ncbi:MAG: leucine-rich repeat protein, partial [Clostridia bacterium]|nr:leucine-rich repeat protein [Clostridia bacterium]